MNKKILIVSETSSSTWNYHLRAINKGEEKYSGGAGLALCGKQLGWDTKIPVTAYKPRSKSHIPELFCYICMERAVEQGLIAGNK